MKYLILSICFLCSVSTFAQQKKVDLQVAAEKMAKLYQLDDSQKNLYVGILKTKMDAIAELGQSPMGVDESQKARLEIEKKYSDSFEDILYADQKLIYQQHKSLIPTKEKLMNPNQHLKIKEVKPKPKTAKQ